MNLCRDHFDAIVFDWAGTTIDYGSRAPVEVFLEVFRSHGVELTNGEVRGPMGLAKDRHIAALLALPRVKSQWIARHGAEPSPGDLSAMYDEFLPLQTEVLRARTKMIPGVVQAIASLRGMGLKIGATTGYVRALMEIAEPLAAAAGFAPDASVCADEVPAGRPAPDMNLRALDLLGVKNPQRAIAVDDTPLGIEAGKACGMVTIAVTMTGNALGLDEAEVAALPSAELKQKLEGIASDFLAAGADFTVRSVAEIPSLFR